MPVFISRGRAWLLACPLKRRRQACGLHLILIAVLSLMPIWFFPPSLVQVHGLDLWVHGALYGLLGALFRWTAGQEKISPVAWGLPAAGAGYGLLMEFLQKWIGGEGRGFSWWDAWADFVGVILFWLIAEWIMTAENASKNQ